MYGEWRVRHNRSAGGVIGGVDVSVVLQLVRPPLEAIARRYIGPDATLTGFSLLRGARSVMFHHDRCGRRLKAFVWLVDVDKATQPTRIAIGSQDTLHYSHHKYSESRYAAPTVERQYAIATMTGPRFHGFIFDTNAIHAGTNALHAGTNESRSTSAGHERLPGRPLQRVRDALLFELNARRKSLLLGDDAPCGAEYFRHAV